MQSIHSTAFYMTNCGRKQCTRPLEGVWEQAGMSSLVICTQAQAGASEVVANSSVRQEQISGL